MLLLYGEASVGHMVRPAVMVEPCLLRDPAITISPSGLPSVMLNAEDQPDQIIVRKDVVLPE